MHIIFTMTQITRSSIIQRMIDVLGLQPGSGQIPVMLRNDIQPVFDINLKTSRIHRSTQRSTTATGISYYLTPTDKDFYITYASLSYTKDATCDNTLVQLTFVQDGITRILIALYSSTTTAGNDNISLSFPYPIKVDRGTNINLTMTFTLGAMSCAPVIGGFLLE